VICSQSYLLYYIIILRCACQEYGAAIVSKIVRAGAAIFGSLGLGSAVEDALLDGDSKDETEEVRT
jgi:hypothetical protein